MTATQKNIFNMLLDQLKEEEPTRTHYQIDINELGQLRGVTVNSNQILKAAEAMCSCIFTIYDEYEGKHVSIKPIASVQYKGKRRLELAINEDFLPFLFPTFYILHHL